MNKSHQKQIPPFARIYSKHSKQNSIHNITHNTSQPNSLPQINKSSEKLQRLNLARDEANRIKNNMRTLESRLNSIKKEKSKNSRQANWALENIEMLRTVKQRFDSDIKRKKQFESQKALQKQELKKKVNQFRKTLKKQQNDAIKNLLSQRSQKSKGMRNQHNLNQTYLYEYNQITKEQNKAKVCQIKKAEKELQQIKKDFRQGLHSNAQTQRLYRLNNYIKKVARTQQRIDRLNNEQNFLLEELKNSEMHKLNNFKSLQQIINPQSKGQTVYKQIYKKVFTSNNKNLKS